MLRGAGEVAEPAAVEGAAVHDHDEEPVAREDEARGERQVAEDHDAGPADDLAALLDIRLRDDALQPCGLEKTVVRQVAHRRGHPEAQLLDEVERVEGEQREEKLEAVPVEAERQDDLAIVLHVCGGLVVADVAGAVADRLEPAEEGKDFKEKRVPERRGEGRLVAELMPGDAAEERAVGAVEKKREEQERKRPLPRVRVEPEK